ncbi:MAG: hypothetical protein QOI10_4023 [Solirubrobacterales bacterium]|jgi:hypothetical protein|nr:hypothetical protein [Solirubrobacterales bacterium]
MSYYGLWSQAIGTSDPGRSARPTPLPGVTPEFGMASSHSFTDPTSAATGTEITTVQEERAADLTVPEWQSR